MTPWMLRASLGAGLVATLATGHARALAAQSSIVIVTGGEASVPVPTLMEGPQAAISNYDVADQLFLRLAELSPTLMTAGDRAFEPALAKSWTRRDSLTLGFRPRPPRHVAGRGARDGQGRGVHLRPCPRSGHRPRPGQAAPPHRVSHRRGRSPRRHAVHPLLCRAAVRRRVPRGPAPGTPPGLPAPDQPGQLAVRSGPRGQRAVSLGSAGAGPVRGARGERAVLPRRTGHSPRLLPACHRCRCPAQHGAERRSGRHGQRAAASQQSRAGGRAEGSAGGHGAVADRGVRAVQPA